MYGLNLLAKLMVLHCQILFSLAIAVIAEAILSQPSNMARFEFVCDFIVLFS